MIIGAEHQGDLLRKRKIKGAPRCWYLMTILNKQGSSNEEINDRVKQGKKAIGSVNSILWDKTITRQTKKDYLYQIIVQGIVAYRAKT